MTRPNPDYLFEQAEGLVAARSAGASTAYYGVFHFCLAAEADASVGTTQRRSSRYTLVYRSIDHKILKDLCVESRKPIPSAKYRPYYPPGGFGSDIRTCSESAIDLQEKRHLADYNPQPRFKTSDANLASSTARDAIGQFQAADQEHRRAFLTLLVCPPR